MCRSSMVTRLQLVFSPEKTTYKVRPLHWMRRWMEFSSRLYAAGEISGAAGEVLLLHTLGKIKPERIAVIGLGPRESISADRVRRSAALACRALTQSRGQATRASAGVGRIRPNVAQSARAATEGAILGLYSFTRYKSSSSGDGLDNGSRRTTAPCH